VGKVKQKNLDAALGTAGELWGGKAVKEPPPVWYRRAPYTYLVRAVRKGGRPTGKLEFADPAVCHCGGAIIHTPIPCPDGDEERKCAGYHKGWKCELCRQEFLGVRQ
jgi:hypothetical protein